MGDSFIDDMGTRQEITQWVVEKKGHDYSP